MNYCGDGVLENAEILTKTNENKHNCIIQPNVRCCERNENILIILMAWLGHWLAGLAELAGLAGPGLYGLYINIQ